MAIGDLIRMERQRAGLTQAELAEKAGVSLASIKAYESRGANHRNPTRKALDKIARACDSDPIFLPTERGDLIQNKHELFAELIETSRNADLDRKTSERIKELQKLCDIHSARVENYSKKGFQPTPELQTNILNTRAKLQYLESYFETEKGIDAVLAELLEMLENLNVNGLRNVLSYVSTLKEEPLYRAISEILGNDTEENEGQ